MDIKVYNLKKWQIYVPKFLYFLFRIKPLGIYKDCQVASDLQFNFKGVEKNGSEEMPITFIGVNKDVI